MFLCFEVNLVSYQTNWNFFQKQISEGYWQARYDLPMELCNWATFATACALILGYLYWQTRTENARMIARYGMAERLVESGKAADRIMRGGRKAHHLELAAGQNRLKLPAPQSRFELAAGSDAADALYHARGFYILDETE